MILLIQSILLCILFTLAILPAQYRNPISQLASYPKVIRKRVYELPQYQAIVQKTEQKNWLRKIIGTLIITVILAFVAFYSGKTIFLAAFFHVFLLVFIVNVYDLIILDFLIFCHSKKLRIPGTQDMDEAYQGKTHHIIGALKGCAICAIVAFLSAIIVILL